MDVAATERAEAEIDKFISSRAKRKGADEANAEASLWRLSEAAHREKKREANRELWVDYHQGQAARLRHTLEVLLAKHEAAATKLLEESGEGEG